MSLMLLTDMHPGCDYGIISPILVDPSGREIWCSDIASQPDDEEQYSSWSVNRALLPRHSKSDIPLTFLSDVLFSEMESGEWTVVLQSDDFGFSAERIFTVIMGMQDVAVVTVSQRVIKFVSRAGLMVLR